MNENDTADGKAPAMSDAQRHYLEGLASGLNVARPVVESAPTSGPDGPMLRGQRNAEQAGQQLTAEERMKRERHPLDRWEEIVARADAGTFPKGTDVLATKFHGLFYVAPAQDSYMCRLRLPNGVISSAQLKGVADLAQRYAGPYAHVTTRANLQLREIGVSDGVNVLTGLHQLGIVNRGSGADNVRNITGSPLAGIDADELLDTRPYAHAMHHMILNSREFYGLPRKFNIAFDGGGRPAVLQETNDIGFSAVEVTGGPHAPGIYFDLGLGGITGHHDFTRDTARLLKPEHAVEVSAAILRLFMEHGNRADRKKARLKYLLDDWGLERFISALDEQLEGKWLIDDGSVQRAPRTTIDRLAHVGVHAQRQAGLYYVGVALPVGKLTCEQMTTLGELAERYGSGSLRLTVWQNLLIPDVDEASVGALTDAIHALGLDTRPHSLRSNLVACTGAMGCKFAAADTKGHAMQIADQLEGRIQLDGPINIHLTGCHHSCAQHYIGDLGLIACKVPGEEEDLEGYDLLVGGGYGAEAKLAKPLCEGVVAEQVPEVVGRLLEHYQQARQHPAQLFSDYINGLDEVALGRLAEQLLDALPSKEENPCP